MLDPDVAAAFARVPGYLDTASVGLPPRRTLRAVRAALEDWGAGRCHPPAFDAPVRRARDAYARIVGIQGSRVALLSQVSVGSGLVASALPDGARVLCAVEDFTSTLLPFVTDPRLQVEVVPLARLLDHVTPAVDLVAVSAVQSADGRLLDLDGLVAAAADAGARTYVDVTQAAGWLPLAADRFDVTSCGAYKWLCCPRGAGFLTVRRGAEWLRPRYPGWYAGRDPWQTLYGPDQVLARDARRFDVSPAWFAFVGAAESLELLADLGVERIGAYSIGLADALRAELDLAPSRSPIVSLATPHGDRLAAAGITAAVRAGRVRLSFYLYNDAADVARAAAALRRG